MTTPPTVAEQEPGNGAERRQVTIRQLLMAEWAKLFTLRSTTFTFLTALALGTGLGLLFSASGAREFRAASAAAQQDFDPVASSLGSYIFAQLAFAAVGVSVFASEYATGTISTSLTSVPQRGRLMAAKIIAFATAALAVGQVIGFLSFLGGQMILSSKHVPHASLGEPLVLRAVAGCGLYLAAVGLLGLAFGALVRSATLGLVLVTVVTLVIPTLSNTLPHAWEAWLQKWWPPNAAAQVMAIKQPADALGPWGGLLLLLLLVGAALVAAAVAFRTRDA
ncbi:ABC transporter permease [Streptomyces sp. DT224]|uniref:ABC transporter permease n=1 Tax=Streptomyces sp. DT224 TaxID=3393426 RepID=UPI003CF69645